jgi:uncharacterized protein (TIGR00299 family) protein
VKALGVDARLEISRVNRSGISATKVDVIAAGEKELPREEFWKSQKARPHKHSHSHGHEHGHFHDHESNPAHKDQPHRGLKEIRQIIQSAAVPEPVKRQAIKTFEALGAAEAKVHNSSVEEIHFHEVGAIDAIVDITCAAAGAQALGVDEWICSPLNVGGGTVDCAHGTFPVPAPATMELLKNAPVYSGEIQKELVTPTGAAIVSTLVTRFGSLPVMKIEKSGYGAGARDFRGFPNVLRLTIGHLEAEASLAPVEEINILEANLDDMNPQVFGYVMDRALDLGALDVFGTAVQMKKNRPGMLLTILCRPEDRQGLTKMLFVETTTLGVRMRRESRATLARRHVSVNTRWGEIRMKLANLNGTISNYAPEYEDCRKIAEQQRVPLKTVMQEAIKIYLEEKNG